VKASQLNINANSIATTNFKKLIVKKPIVKQNNFKTQPLQQKYSPTVFDRLTKHQLLYSSVSNKARD